MNYFNGDYYYSIYRNDPRIFQDINRAINDKFNTIHYYTRLAELAPTEPFRQYILTIRQDEIQNYGIFSNAYLELTKQYPQVSKAVDLPKDYKQGIRKSIKAEQQTVTFYMNIAQRATNPTIKSMFLRAANDEQRHYRILSNLNSYV
jgi:rubrerythrin